jgi:D-alanyl-D-alanine carboxypeptidase
VFEHSRLDAVLQKVSRDPELTGVVARIEVPAEGLVWEGSTGDLDTGTPFFVASTTKLFTTAIILRLADAGKLELTDSVKSHIDGLDGLHVIDGVDLTGDITIHHLLSQTSGLPDYFQGKQTGGASLEDSVRAGEDRSWGIDHVLETSRNMGAKFPPGAGKKALYSDTNYQLLGRIIEIVDGRSYRQAVEDHVSQPLGLVQTWVYSDPTDGRPAPLRDGDRPLHIPQAMISFGPDGGVVSTAGDLMVFLRAFFEGEIFDQSRLASMMEFRRIFFPLQYGVGLSRFRLPRVMSPFSAPPDLIGHSGLSGAFAFLDRDQGAYFAGTVNNLNKPARAFRWMFRMAQTL